MIEYECKKDSTYFNIDKDDVRRAEYECKYLVCPVCGSRNVRIRDNYERIMEERSAVNI